MIDIESSTIFFTIINIIIMIILITGTIFLIYHLIKKLIKYYKTGKVIEGKQKYYFDTTNLIIDYLTEIGIKRENIFDSNICSVCNVANMYSYRAEKEKSDRNMNIVMLK